MIGLDTHALVWWVSDPKRVPAKATRLVAGAVKAGESIAISSISVWEIAMLVARGRLALTMHVDAWIERVEALPFLTFVPVDSQIALPPVGLGAFASHDPAARMILPPVPANAAPPV